MKLLQPRSHVSWGGTALRAVRGGFGETARPRFQHGSVVVIFALITAATQATPPTLVWGDEFNQADGAAPDPAKWGYNLGRGDPPGWGNQELQSYTDSRDNSVVVSDAAATDGHALAIRAQNTPTGYTSARLVTAGKQTFAGGRLEARLRMPQGRGLWPAFWALGSNIDTVGWPACGEIDVMEWVGPAIGVGRIRGSLHAPGYFATNSLNADYVLPEGASFSGGYHVFAVDWYSDQIVFSVDGHVYQTRKKSGIPTGAQWPFDQPFYLLLNLAVGGGWPGPPDASAVFPQDFRVDYVRVYSLPVTPPAGLVFAPAAPGQLRADNSHPGGIGLSWTAPTGTFGAALTGYRLERAMDAAFTQSVLVRTLGTATTFADKGLLAEHPYFYRISAVSVNGTSEPSQSVSTQLTVATTEGGPGTHFSNVSTRAYVGTGDNVAIVGFVLQGADVRRLLVRGVGPTLAAYGVGAPVADPLLTLYDQGTGAPIARDDDWSASDSAAEARTAATATGAFALPEGSRDAAVVVDLPSGIYTAVVEGKNGGTGTALVEAYEVPATIK